MNKFLVVLAMISLPLPVLAEIPGHRYVWVDAPYVEDIPAKISGGDTTCKTDYLGNVNCTTSPIYYTQASTRNFYRRVHVDCTDQTYDAKGDGLGWQQWGADPGIRRLASRACLSRTTFWR